MIWFFHEYWLVIREKVFKFWAKRYWINKDFRATTLKTKAIGIFLDTFLCPYPNQNTQSKIES